jgi:hypothetical protein
MILVAILVLVVSTAYNYAMGIGLTRAYIVILGNPLGAAAFAAALYVGAILPVADQTRDRQAKLRSLSNRSLAAIFIVSMILIPVIADLRTMRIFLVLGVLSISTALASSMYRLTANTRKMILSTTLQVLGSLLIVFAAAAQVLETQLFPELLIRHRWAISIVVLVVGMVLVLVARRGAKGPGGPTTK